MLVFFRIFYLAVCLLFWLSSFSHNEKKTIKARKSSYQQALKHQDTNVVRSVPEKYNYPKFYHKYLNAQGIPIISGESVDNLALLTAKSIIIKMLAKIPEVNKALVHNKAHILIVGARQQMSDLPEYTTFDKAVSETGIVMNDRARGMGPMLSAPYCSCGEENLLCLDHDRYKGQNILVHEFAHAIAIIGISFVDTSFRSVLNGVFLNAKKQGLWNNTYAMSNLDEYFAVGVQCWFNVSLKAVPSDGIHNEISTRLELEYYDPVLYKLISKYFLKDDRITVCN